MHCCKEMERLLAVGEVAMVYVPKFREYGIRVLDGGSSFQVIKYCPWCGSELPGSLRNKWIEELERMNLEPDSPDLPKEYLSEEWWTKKV